MGEGIESLHALGNDSVTAAEASEALRKYCGVGPKVANCISLFSMGKIDSFPIDVWVKKSEQAAPHRAQLLQLTFQPWRLSDGDKTSGLVTGYYEPLLKGNTEQTSSARFTSIALLQT